ncbi:unnamed protein product, partial [Prorocentrum cordatum]
AAQACLGPVGCQASVEASARWPLRLGGPQAAQPARQGLAPWRGPPQPLPNRAQRQAPRRLALWRRSWWSRVECSRWVAYPAAPPRPRWLPRRIDIRVRPIQHDAPGFWFREFRLAVERMVETPLNDFPVRGPRTTLWFCRFTVANLQTPLGRHASWKVGAKMQANDGGVENGFMCCQMLENMDALLCMGLDRVRGNVAVCPVRQGWASAELQKETSVMREARKACEERASAKTEGKKDNAKRTWLTLRRRLGMA